MTLEELEIVDQSWKWAPIKLYERYIGRMEVYAKELGWRLTVDLTLRQELES